MKKLGEGNEDISMVCTPFEADHQLSSLIKQGIADVVVTNDGDVMFQGAARMVRNLENSGKCSYLKYESLKGHLRRLFKSSRPLSKADMAFFCSMLGTDYCPRKKKHGPVAVEKAMVDYMKLATDDERKAFISAFVDQLDGEALVGEQPKKKFWHSLECWVHLPVFAVVPTMDGANARQLSRQGQRHIKFVFVPCLIVGLWVYLHYNQIL